MEKKAKESGTPIDVCLTCGSSPDDFGCRENGTYRFMGEELECDCDTQIMLRKHYLLADIPEQYMRLDWDRDYKGSLDVVNIYLDKWDAAKRNGMGMEFGGTNLAVGKTFAATHIGKSLIKLRVPVLFTPFMEVLRILDRDETQDALKKTAVLILDEVIPPTTAKAHGVFADRFEALIRERTNWNRPTIMTTNMSEENLKTTYERTYSLLSAKQIRVDMEGEDARMNLISKQNLEMVMNGEVRPIS